MAKDFLQIPIECGLITSQQELMRCSLSESVAEMIRLIATTHFGESKQDESFGNELWENDFETLVNVQAFKEKLAQSLLQAILTHEKRITGVKVIVGFEQIVVTLNKRRIRQRIQIKVDGTLRKTNEAFSHQEVFFLGPLSYY